jgi:hypothetical protein
VQIGTAGKQTMAGNGDYLTFTIDQDVPGSQGQFIGISNSNDATCIAWVTVQMHDDSQKGVWTGDIGRTYVTIIITIPMPLKLTILRCGESWFESQEVAGALEDGTPYRPSCTWLDGNHDNNIASASMKFSTYAYGSELSHVTLGDACASTIFSPDGGENSGKTVFYSILELILMYHVQALLQCLLPPSEALFSLVLAFPGWTRNSSSPTSPLTALPTFATRPPAGVQTSPRLTKASSAICHPRLFTPSVQRKTSMAVLRSRIMP